MKSESVERLVCWTYKDHRGRWIVALLAGFNVVLSTAGAFSGAQGEASAVGNVLFPATLTAFWMMVALVCVRPQVDGCLIRRDDHFDLDLGRRVFDLAGGISEVIHVLTHKRPVESINIGILNTILMKRWFPRRIRRVSNIEAIVDVSVESGPLGPRIMLHDVVDGAVVIDDLHLTDVSRIKSAIADLLRAN